MANGNEAIEGSLSVSRDLNVGGDSDIKGSSRIGHNLRVGGWIDSGQIIGAHKGLFKDLESLKKMYPKPETGMYVLVGTELPAEVWYSEGGEWHDLGSKSGGEAQILVDGEAGYTMFIGKIQEDEIDGLGADALDYCLGKKPGFYRLMQGGFQTGWLMLMGDSMLHQLTQVIISHYKANSDGVIDFRSHDDQEIFQYYRSWGISSPNNPDGAWTKWQPFIPKASTSHDGLMSLEDKKKLDGVQEGANKYALPTASQDKLGGVKSKKTGTTSGRDYNVEVDSDGAMKVNVPWSDTKYPVATEGASGLMSSDDKKKLDKIKPANLIGEIDISEMDAMDLNTLRSYYGQVGDRPACRLLVKMKDSQSVIGTLDIFGDTMMHQLTQVFTTHSTLKDGTFDSGNHADDRVYTYFRSWCLSSPGKPSQAWTPWQLTSVPPITDEMHDTTKAYGLVNGIWGQVRKTLMVPMGMTIAGRDQVMKSYQATVTIESALVKQRLFDLVQNYDDNSDVVFIITTGSYTYHVRPTNVVVEDGRKGYFSLRMPMVANGTLGAYYFFTLVVDADSKEVYPLNMYLLEMSVLLRVENYPALSSAQLTDGMTYAFKNGRMEKIAEPIETVIIDAQCYGHLDDDPIIELSIERKNGFDFERCIQGKQMAFIRLDADGATSLCILRFHQEGLTKAAYFRPRNNEYLMDVEDIGQDVRISCVMVKS